MSADILAKFTIKEDKDIGGWVARCASMPNTVIHAREIPAILRQIDLELKKAFPDSSDICGEITSLNAEYYISRREEVPLSAFQELDDEADPEDDWNRRKANLKRMYDKTGKLEKAINTLIDNVDQITVNKADGTHETIYEREPETEQEQ